MSEFSQYLSTPEEIIEDARNGKMIVLVDAEDRENEGDLIIPAQMATPEAITAASTPAPPNNDLPDADFSLRLTMPESSLPLFCYLPDSRYRYGTSVAHLALAHSHRHGVAICPASRADAFRKRL